MEASCEGGQDQEGTVAPYMDGCRNFAETEMPFYSDILE